MIEHDFLERQIKFSSAVRAQREQELSFVSSDRLKFYQQLVYYANSGVITPCFPILSAILGADKWQELLEAFLKNYQSTTPLFHEVSGYFVDFLKVEQMLSEDLLDLAHFEWLELYLSICDAEIDSEKTLFQAIESKLPDCQIKLNPSLILMEYQYPVHLITESRYPMSPEKTYIVGYRDRSYEVCFEHISLLNARLIFLLQERVEESLSDILQELSIETSQCYAIDMELKAMIRKWLETDLIETIHEVRECV